MNDCFHDIEPEHKFAFLIKEEDLILHRVYTVQPVQLWLLYSFLSCLYRRMVLVCLQLPLVLYLGSRPALLNRIFQNIPVNTNLVSRRIFPTAVSTSHQAGD